MNQHTSSAKGVQTSGENISYWIDSVKPIESEILKSDIETEILVIGGGISGLTAAYCLLQSGHQVTLVEDGLIGSGETGRTTAHLTNALDDRYYHIEKLFGEEKTKLAAESHTHAIDWIQNTIRKENIACDFKRINGYLFLHPSDKKETLEKELKATQNAGIETKLLDSIPGLASEKGKCIMFPSQGQFHIMKYIKGLTGAVLKAGAKIYTRTKAVHVTEKGAVANGFAIRASKIVVATNTPINDFVTMHTKQFAYRTYVIASTISKNQIEPALWWDTGDQDSKWITNPYHYVRLQSFNDQFDLLISGGEDHKTGQADKEDIPEDQRFTRLEQWTRKRFPLMKDIVYRWSGQVLEPIDSMAYIGKNPGNENVYIITGDSGNGMTHGTLGGIIISDMINNVYSPWEALYDPRRIPLKDIRSYLHETLNMAGEYAEWFTGGDVDSVKDIKTGEGAIIRSGLKKIAVYKDENNRLNAYSAVCPHLGCVIQWNPEEKSFDCPCHGSRFTKEGKVVNGPATEDLKKLKLKSD